MGSREKVASRPSSLTLALLLGASLQHQPI